MRIAVVNIKDLAEVKSNMHPRQDAGPYWREGLAALSELPEPLRHWMELERFHPNRDVDVRHLSPLTGNLPDSFYPDRPHMLGVPGYWIDAAQMEVVRADPISEAVCNSFFRKCGGVEQCLFLVHPLSVGYFRDFLCAAKHHPARPDVVFTGSPTTSIRTMLVWMHDGAGGPFHVKLSLDCEIGQSYRMIPRAVLARSVGVSRLLCAAGSLSPDIVFWRELAGMIPRGLARGGMLIREITTKLLRGEARYVPCSSLCAPRTDGRPAPVETMAASSGCTPVQFLCEHVIAPFARHWTNLVLTHGILHEPHAQNILLETTRADVPTGTLAYRDTEDLLIDFPYRVSLGLDIPDELPVVSSINSDYLLSRHRDWIRKSLCTYFVYGTLEPFALSLQQHIGCNRAEASRIMRDRLETELSFHLRDLTGQNVLVSLDDFRTVESTIEATKARQAREQVDTLPIRAVPL